MRRRLDQRQRQRGFTLLEVLVAVAILGLGLTAILSAQFSAVTGVGHARHMSLAVGLARCKMSEIEQQLATEGFPEVSLEDSGACCEGDTTPNISCSWVVERPTFPELNLGGLDLDADLDGTPLGNLAEGSKSGSTTGSDLGDVASSLAGGDTGDIAGAAAAGIGGIISMVMEIVYPELKNIFEASTRRVTLVLTWTEGDRSYDIELVQWVTQPQPGLMPDADQVTGGIPGVNDTGSGATPGGGNNRPGGSRGPTTTRPPGGGR
ncbi:MAG TPA: prepilin-type N-terminal cleavage/methylation domain-containing protein [Polyangiaceae bacterium]|nr:prepilin-type N-terminal cleavage/methylation domain-containing protein [Polyangiaceae bacterium]